MLKSAASASLGVVAGMVQTATIAGPAQLLAAAGSDLIGGVKKLLGDTAQKREPLFDFSGLDFNMQPTQLVGKEVYILFHRGSRLDENKLSVRSDGRLVLPYHDGQALEDGAWILLRMRKSTEYSGVREWFDTARAWRQKLQGLVDDVQLGATSKEDALKRLRPSAGGGGDETLYDEMMKLRAIIGIDGVLTELEARTHIAGLRMALASAMKAVNEGSRDVFHEAIVEARNGLLAGETRGAGLEAFHEAFMAPLPEREDPSLESVGGGFSLQDVRALPGVVGKVTAFEAAKSAGGQQR
jgi:hypothetical protein